MKFEIKENKLYKCLKSVNYNFVFNKETGFFARWGKTKKEDPIFAPAPEILDLEISSGGDCSGECPFCYKGNGGDQETHNMTFDEFKIIFNKLPPMLTQIAFGIMNISTNPDFFKMMEYSKEHGVIPNYTCHGLDVTSEIAEKTTDICGAVAVSIVKKEKSYNAIKMFIDAGMKQINIHFVLSSQTYEKAFQLIDDVVRDERLSRLNAIVFLAYKPKGRGSDYFKSVSDVSKYKKLINYCKEKNIGVGFDSCSAPLYMKSIENDENYEKEVMYSEPCESSIFSSYINCHGKFFPCSFSEGVEGWTKGLDVLNCENFVRDIWMHEKTKDFRKRLIHSCDNCECKSQKYCRSCIVYNEITSCKGVI